MICEITNSWLICIKWKITDGKGLPIYGLKIFIDSKDYSVFYRVLEDNHEYSNLFNDGEECLSENKIFGIQLRLVRKIVF